MYLTYDNQKNRFVIRGAYKCPIDFKIYDGLYITTSIKAAARFRKVADQHAENVFKKSLLVDIPIPSGGVPTPQGLKLFNFQEQMGVPHILGHNRSYLAYAPGLGKTTTALGAVSKKPGRTLIICPSFLITNWAREITKWFARDFPTIAKVTKETVNWNADFLIVSDAMIFKPFVQENLSRINFKFVFVDEGHRFKTPEALRTRALFGGKLNKGLSPGLIYNAEHVSILSGTPMLNRPIELWPMLNAMAPELIDSMSYWDFGFRYGAPTQNEYGWHFLGASNESDLRNRIMGRFMQRLTKEDVLPDLPKKMREIIVLNNDGRTKEVMAFDKSLARKLLKVSYDTLNLGEYAGLRHENGLAKVNETAKFISEILENDENESIILFAYHRDVVEKLKEKLLKFHPLIINGGVKSEERTKIEDKFQSGRNRLIIGNILAMNLGLTLTRATRVIFCEYDWTPANNEQAEDRANRIGSKWSVFCQYLVLPNSIDETILNSVLKKQTTIEKVIA